MSFAHSNPVVVTARLLLFRRGTLADHQVAATARAIRGLKADNPEELFGVARCLGELIVDLDSGRWPDLPQRERRAIRRECADRAANLLVQSEEKGFRDAGRLESVEFAGLKQHPIYQSLLDRLKQPPKRPTG